MVWSGALCIDVSADWLQSIFGIKRYRKGICGAMLNRHKLIKCVRSIGFKPFTSKTDSKCN